MASIAPGLALCGALAALSIRLGELEPLRSHGLGALTLAIVIGLLVGHGIGSHGQASLSPGVDLSKQQLLRLGIVLYGLRVTAQDLLDVGWQGLALATLMVCLTFPLASWLGTRLFGLDRRTSMLIGAGSSICGAAAVLATAPVVRGRPEQVTVAVATVVTFGTLAIFLYPALYALGQDAGLLFMDTRQFGAYIGATVHEVAQVVAAGSAVGAVTESTAVIVKMMRVMLLAPFLVTLSLWLARHPEPDPVHEPSDPGARRSFPWFAVAFLAVVGLNSLPILPATVVHAGVAADQFLLAMAMAALGLTTRASAIRRAGIKPLILALLLFAWLIVGGAALSQLFMR